MFIFLSLLFFSLNNFKHFNLFKIQQLILLIFNVLTKRIHTLFFALIVDFQVTWIFFLQTFRRYLSEFNHQLNILKQKKTWIKEFLKQIKSKIDLNKSFHFETFNKVELLTAIRLFFFVLYFNFNFLFSSIFISSKFINKHD